MNGRTLSDADLRLIAQAISRIRPEWPERAVLDYLDEHFTYGAQPFAAVLVAAVFYAVDRRHATPLDLDGRGRHWIYAADACHPRAPAGIERDLLA